MMHRRGGGKFRGSNRNFQPNDRFQAGKNQNYALTGSVVYDFVISLFKITMTALGILDKLISSDELASKQTTFVASKICQELSMI